MDTTIASNTPDFMLVLLDSCSGFSIETRTSSTQQSHVSMYPHYIDGLNHLIICMYIYIYIYIYIYMYVCVYVPEISIIYGLV